MHKPDSGQVSGDSDADSCDCSLSRDLAMRRQRIGIHADHGTDGSRMFIKGVSTLKFGLMVLTPLILCIQ